MPKAIASQYFLANRSLTIWKADISNQSILSNWEYRKMFFQSYSTWHTVVRERWIDTTECTVRPPCAKVAIFDDDFAPNWLDSHACNSALMHTWLRIKRRRLGATVSILLGCSILWIVLYGSTPYSSLMWISSGYDEQGHLGSYLGLYG